jgi:peroxiredoxin Q/BCP
VSIPQPGEPAPDFTLPSTQGDISLRDLTRDKKVVLAFYFEDATPICSGEVSALKEDYDLIRELGAEVVAVSADSLASHEAFAQRLGGFPFPLASDSGLAVTRLYDVLDETGKRSRRAIFVIDRGETILHTIGWYQPGNVAQYEEMLRALGFEG